LLHPGVRQVRRAGQDAARAAHEAEVDRALAGIEDPTPTSGP